MDILMLVLVGFVVCGMAAPQYGDEQEYHAQHHDVHQLHTTPIPILQHKHETHKDGYQFSYKTGNGIQAEESGYIKKTGEKDDDNVIVMHGSVSYTGPDGIPVKLTYIADEHGFQPQGAHLPTPPPIPAEIQKVLDQQAVHQQVVHQPEHQEEAYDDQEQYGGHY